MNHRKKGLFWIPGAESKKVAGELIFDLFEQPVLQIMGALADEVQAFRSIIEWSPKEKFPVIFGISNDQRPYTLARCNLISCDSLMSPLPVQNIGVDYILEGLHFRDPERLSFRMLELEFTGLFEWANISGLQSSSSTNESGEKTTHWSYTKPSEVMLGGQKIKASIRWNTSESLNRIYGRLSISENCYFRIELSPPLFLDKIRELIIPSILGFFKLVFQKDVLLKKISSEIIDGADGHKKQIKVFWDVNAGLQSDPDKWRADPLFYLAHITALCPTAWDRWMELCELAFPLVRIIFEKVLAPGRFNSNRFLNAVQAAEAYHRLRYASEEAPLSEYRKRVEAILKHIPEEDREWLKRKLSNSNQKALGVRLQELLAANATMSGWSHELSEKTAKQIAKARHCLTHTAIARDSTSSASGRDLERWANLLRWVLMREMLKEIGLGELSSELIRQYPAYAYYCRINRPPA